MIYIVTHASVDVGLGHFIRSYTLLSEFISHPRISANNVCLCVDSEIKVEGFIKPQHLANVKFITIDCLIRKIKPEDTLILDLLTISKEIFDHIKQNSFKTVSVSPVFSYNHSVDFLFLRGDIEPKTNRKAHLIFNGYQYNVIRQGVPKISAGIYESSLHSERMHIGIAMGATDPKNCTLSIVDELRHLPHNITLWVAIGLGYPHDLNDLVKVISESKNCEIIIANVNESLWSLLSFCSLLILQGGLTTAEACYAGIPSINIPRFEAQSLFIQKLIDQNLSWQIKLDDLASLSQLVLKLLSDKPMLMNVHLRLKSLQEKSGAQNIIETLLEFKAIVA